MFTHPFEKGRTHHQFLNHVFWISREIEKGLQRSENPKDLKLYYYKIAKSGMKGGCRNRWCQKGEEVKRYFDNLKINGSRINAANISYRGVIYQKNKSDSQNSFTYSTG